MSTRIALHFVPLLLAAFLPVRGADLAVERFSVEPGTDLLLVEDHRTPVVYGAIEFPLGHWSPWATANGAEEAFDVQLNDPAGALRTRADQLSVELSIGMYSHHASVDFSCLAEDLEPALALVRDLLNNRELDRRELQRWTKNDKLEWDGAQKDPGFRIRQATARLLYSADDPRRREYEKPARNETRIERLTAARDVVVRLPGRAIGFAGDLSRADVERLAAGLLPPVLDAPPAGLEVRLGPLVPRDRLPDAHTETMPRIAQTFFAYSRASLTHDDPRYPSFLVADHVLGGHFFSRLYDALRHEGGETYGSSTEGAGGVYAEAYALSTFTRADNTAATEKKLRGVLRVFHADGITEEERQAAVGFMLGQRPFSRQAPSQILRRYLSERRRGLPPGFHDDLVDRAASVSLAEINALVRDFFDPAQFTLVKVTPR